MSEIIPFRRSARPSENVLRFLDSLGHREDAETYLKIFTSQKPETFAVVVLDEDVVRDDLDAVIFDLRYLVKMSLFPVVLVHASQDAMSKVDVEGYFEKARMPVKFLWDDIKPQELPDIVQNRIQKNTLAMMHIDKDRNIFSEIGKVARILKTRKIIYLRKAGGLYDQKTGEPIRLVNLRFDREKLTGQGVLSQDDEQFMLATERLIDQCTHSVHLVAVAPVNFLREIFTVKSMGTLIQQGTEIKCCKNWQEVNRDGLKILLQTSFGKKVKDSFFNHQIEAFYIEESYRGAALVHDFEGKSFLSHFAAGTEARGFGVGNDLWQAVNRDHKKIFWRSPPERFINRWYTKQCDGLHKTPDWIVFWKGIVPSEISGVIEYTLAQEDDFE